MVSLHHDKGIKRIFKSGAVPGRQQAGRAGDQSKVGGRPARSGDSGVRPAENGDGARSFEKNVSVLIILKGCQPVIISGIKRDGKIVKFHLGNLPGEGGVVGDGVSGYVVVVQITGGSVFFQLDVRGVVVVGVVYPAAQGY